jgi:hypothetical protein
MTRAFSMVVALAVLGPARIGLAQPVADHLNFEKACVDVTVPAGAECSFDSACPPGHACVAPSPQTCSPTVGGPGHCFPICPE